MAQRQASLQRASPRERFNHFVILASAEIALLAALLLMFFMYNFGQNIPLAALSLAAVLGGSILIRRSLQIAQIVLVMSIVVMEIILILKADFHIELFGGLGPEVLPVAFLIIDVLLVVYLVKNAVLSQER